MNWFPVSSRSLSGPGFELKIGPWFIAQRLPTRIGTEAWPMPVTQRAQCCDDVLNPALACIVQWSASERRKACAEDHTCIHEIAVCNDAFAQTGYCLVDHRQDQTIGEL